jgi:hypothetical protein
MTTPITVKHILRAAQPLTQPKSLCYSTDKLRVVSPLRFWTNGPTWIIFCTFQEPGNRHDVSIHGQLLAVGTWSPVAFGFRVRKRATKPMSSKRCRRSSDKVW